MRGRPSVRNKYILFGDLVLILISILGSYALRFELGPQFFQYIPSAIWIAATSLLVKPLIYYLFGLYRRMWMYASVQELKLIIVSVTTASVVVSSIVISLCRFGCFS